MRLQLEVELTAEQVIRTLRKISRFYSLEKFAEIPLEQLMAKALVEYSEERTGTFMRTTPAINAAIQFILSGRNK